MNDERRTRIREVLALIKPASLIIQDVWREEDDAYDRVPENLSGSPKGQQSQTAVQALEHAVDAFEELVDDLEFVLNTPM